MSFESNQRYAEAVALIRSWIYNPINKDEKLGIKMEKYFQKLDTIQRGKFIPCRGCPNIECTCLTELEEELLNKSGNVLILRSALEHIEDNPTDCGICMNVHIELENHYEEIAREALKKCFEESGEK